jgi:hypothetical protein
MNKSLYEDKHPNKSLKNTGFANKEKALQTLYLIENYDLTYQKQVVITMYNRAKYHKYRKPGMIEAMKIFKKWLKIFNSKNFLIY